jgi:hypothetical protein
MGFEIFSQSAVCRTYPIHTHNRDLGAGTDGLEARAAAATIRWDLKDEIGAPRTWPEKIKNGTNDRQTLYRRQSNAFGTGLAHCSRQCPRCDGTANALMY